MKSMHLKAFRDGSWGVVVGEELKAEYANREEAERDMGIYQPIRYQPVRSTNKYVSQ